MPTVLDKTLKRALSVKGEAYVLTISPQGFTLIPRGKRKGRVILWSEFVSGEAALATALNASLQFNAENEDRQRARGRRHPPRPSASAKAAGKASRARKQ